MKDLDTTAATEPQTVPVAELRANSEARKALAKRDAERARVQHFYDHMEKVRIMQQAAAKSPHANTEKLQARLRATRCSKELPDMP